MQVFILSNLLFFFLISCTSIPPTSPPPTTQTTPPSVLTVDSFILDGFSILAHEKADFNMDGFEDAILILKNINEEEMSDYVNDIPTLRPLLFLAGDKTGSLHLVARNDKAVYCFDCGGQMGDPFNSLVVNKQFVSINHYGGSRIRWTRNITFKYDIAKKSWFLHKDEQNDISTIAPTDTSKLDTTSINTPLHLFDLYAS
ncbi:MAG: hypothetical protein JKY03_11685 [Aureispira sp.]|nr:hypothetical protein [Aureispira sp.]